MVITPSLVGTLDLEFPAAVDPATLVGTSFPLFTWNAPLDPANTFTTIKTDPRAAFDLSNLYTTGTVTLASVTPIPEPASLALLALALTCLLGRPLR